MWKKRLRKYYKGLFNPRLCLDPILIKIGSGRSLRCGKDKNFRSLSGSGSSLGILFLLPDVHVHLRRTKKGKDKDEVKYNEKDKDDNKYSYKTKHSKNCESCPTQVTWKVKFKCKICLDSSYPLRGY